MALTFDIDGDLGAALLTDFFDGGPEQPPGDGIYRWVGTDPTRYLSFTLDGPDGPSATLIEFGITGGAANFAISTTPIDITALLPAWQANRVAGVADVLFGTGTVFELTAEAAATSLRTYHAGNHLVGNDGANTLYADHADATLEGGDGNDTLVGGAGAQMLDGGGGDDLVEAGTGSATLHGGAGYDVLSYRTNFQALTIDTAGYGLHDQGETDPFDGFEVLRGGMHSDTFVFDTLRPMPPSLRLQGLAGNENFWGGAGLETIDYSADDTFGGTLGAVVNLSATTLGKASTLPADAGSDAKAVLALLLGGTPAVASEAIRDGFGDLDVLYDAFIIAGSIHADFMLGGGDADTLGGNAGDDWLFGEAGSDVLEGGADGDRLFGGGDSDTLRGGAGDDVLEGGAKGDVLEGGEGTDTASYAHAAGAVTASLAASGGNTGDAAGDSYGLIENLTGSRFNDALVGDDGANVIDGGAGNDVMKGRLGDDIYVVNSSSDVADESGGGGRDTVRSAVSFSLADGRHARGTIETLVLTGSAAIKGSGNGGGNTLTGNAGANGLSGGGGNDTLAGAGGKDVLTGGAGRDAFVFATKPASSTVDTIKDFGHHFDRIWLDDAAMAAIGRPGNLAKAAFYSHAGATHGHDRDDRVVYDSHSGKLYYDDDGSGRHAAVQIAMLSGHPKLDAADFLIV